jgi:flagella basal body P-ring formation protein FlgA
VTQLDYQQDLGRFTATLTVTGDGMEPISTRISGQVADMIELPVATTRLSAGAIPRAGEVRMARVRVTAVHTEVARDPAMVIGMQLKRPIVAGTPIQMADLMQPTEVTRGEPVRLQLVANGLSVTGQGVALESGASGEQIRVRNISSQAVIQAEIVGPGIVRVIPGSAPITAQARLGLSALQGG